MKRALLYFLLLALASCGTSTDKKESNNKPAAEWVEFWDSFSMKKQPNYLNIIQALNEHDIASCKYHYLKQSTDDEGKFIVALKTDDKSDWNYYLVWDASHEIMGPYATIEGVTPPVISK